MSTHICEVCCIPMDAHPQEDNEWPARCCRGCGCRMDEEDGPFAMVLDCGNPDCIMPGYHYRSECVTAAEMEELQKESPTT